MASDGEDEDLELLRNAALASVKHRVIETVEAPSGFQEDDEEELLALREAALKTKKVAAPDSQLQNNPLSVVDQPVNTLVAATAHVPQNVSKTFKTKDIRAKCLSNHHRSHRYEHGKGFKRNQLTTHRQRGNNLIVINTVPPDVSEPTTAAGQLVRPQDRWAGVASETPIATSPPPRQKPSGKFSRFDSGDSDSNDSFNESTQSSSSSNSDSDDSREDSCSFNDNRSIDFEPDQTEDEDNTSKSMAELVDSSKDNIDVALGPQQKDEQLSDVDSVQELCDELEEVIKNNGCSYKAENTYGSGGAIEEEENNSTCEKSPEMHQPLLRELSLYVNNENELNSQENGMTSPVDLLCFESTDRKVIQCYSEPDKALGQAVFNESLDSRCLEKQMEIFSCGVDLEGLDNQGLPFAEKKVLEARRKKFETNEEIKPSELRKTISLKGIVPRSRRRKHTTTDEKSSEVGIGVDLDNAPKKSRGKKFEEKERSAKERRADLGTRVRVGDMRMKKSRNVGRNLDSESEQSKDSYGSSSQLSPCSFEDSDSHLEDMVSVKHSRNVISRLGERHNAESRLRFDKPISVHTMKSRGQTDFRTVKDQLSSRQNFKERRRKKYFEEETSSGSISDDQFKQAVCSVVTADSKQAAFLSSSRGDVKRAIKSAEPKKVKLFKKHIFDPHLRYHSCRDSFSDSDSTKDKKQLRDSSSPDQRQGSRRKSPFVKVTVNSNPSFSQNHSKRLSVHQRLGVVTKEERAMRSVDRSRSPKRKVKSKQPSDKKYPRRERETKKKQQAHLFSDANWKTEQSDEDELDKKIKRIKRQNAAILKRQEEVQKDKERYG